MIFERAELFAVSEHLANVIQLRFDFLCWLVSQVGPRCSYGSRGFALS